jgi:hypothetical protein
VDHAAVDRRVGTRQVDVLEEAALGLGLGEAPGAQPVLVDRDQLAGLDLAHEGGADDVEGRRLGGDDPAALEAAEDERADALGIAGGVQGVLVHEDEAERPRSRGSTIEGRPRVRSGWSASRAVTNAVSVVLPRPLLARQWPGQASALLDQVAQLGGVGQVAVVASASAAVVAAARKVGWAFSHVEPPVVE